MADEAQDSGTPKKDTKEAAHDIESQIKGVMSSRVAHFKEQADSLTFEGVRRLLEKDLGLETYALDVHKRFIKQILQECLHGADDDDGSKTSGETEEKSVCRGEVAESPEGLQSQKGVKEPCSEDEDKMEDSPVMGLLTGHKKTKSESVETKGIQNKVPSEITIKKAIIKRVSYIKANSEEVTMAGLRRLLEGDLKLDKHTLDPYKKFISQQLDEVLQSREVSEPATNAKKNVKKKPYGKASKKVSSGESSDSSDSKGDEEEEEEKVSEPATNVKKNVKKNSYSKASKKVSSGESSDSSDSKGDVEEKEKEKEEEEEEVKPRKKSIPKGKMQNSDGLKKGKRPAKETNVSSKKRSKPAETVSEENSDAENGGDASEDGHSESSAEKPVKKKEVSTPAYGKHVEHLKSVIKSCGMSVPPVIYKKVKQVPENKREAHLIKELEEILSREGLSANPSEKEIKEVRKKKERAKELEGIDMSNIVSSSRRRSSTTSFVPPPKPQIPVKSEGDDVEDTDEDNDEDVDDKEDGDDDDSQSEEFNEGDDEDSE